MRLTDDERNMILRLRDENKKQKDRRHLRLELLKTAAKYDAWLYKYGRGSSFSTFCHEFDFRNGAHRCILSIADSGNSHFIFEKIESILAQASHLD